MIKVGIIGCGGIAGSKHLPSIKNNTDFEVIAFCDIIIDKAIEYRKKFNYENAKVYEDYNEMLKDKEIEAVFVCTPNISHAKITIASLNAGKHVMCEKPMAVTYKDSIAMIEASKKNNKLLTIGYQNRYRAELQYLKKECEKGYFGDIYFAKAKAIRRRAVPTWGVFLDKDKQGGGPLIDIGTHSLDLTLYMMNNYEPAYAVGTIYHELNKQTDTANMWGDWDTNKFTVEDSAFGFVVMKNGATISLECAWALNFVNEGEAQTLLCGTKAGADMENGLRINEVKNNSRVVSIPTFTSGSVDFFSGKETTPSDFENKIFSQAILGNCEIVVKPEQAAVVTMILEGIYKSAESGKPYYFEK